jgi:diaminopimelate epimerase
MIPFVKAHACGNDFLYVDERDARERDRARLARAICDRHAGAGADGLILFRRTAGGAAMRLLNADGSHAEVSGNGVRGLAAVLTDVLEFAPPGGRVRIDTDAGEKVLSLVEREGRRPVFRAQMGPPTDVRRQTLEVEGQPLEVVTLGVGNPQCVRLEARVDEARLHRVGAALARHPAFPEGTNVELAAVEAPDLVRILIWERGVGPTLSSGTGSCAAAVAAAAFGGASRDVRVVAPGGAQRVEWREDGLYLTGWAEVLFRGEWID